MRAMNRRARILQLLLVAGCLNGFSGTLSLHGGQVESVAADWSGRLGLVLESGVRIRARGQLQWSDLHIDFLCRDGRWDVVSDAWFDRMSVLEHRATLLSAAGDAESLRLEFEVVFTSHAPVFAGGTGRYVVELRKALGVIRGDFSGTLERLGDSESTNLWTVWRGYALGSTQRPDWPVSIDAGRARSLKRPGATVLASIGPLPRVVSGFERPQQDEHPRLLVRTRDLAALKALSASEAGGTFAEALGKTLEGPAGDWWRCHGSRAAGWAALWRTTGDDTMADKAAACAKEAMAAMRAGPHSMAYGRNLAGLALAYDLSVERWPEMVRDEARSVLAKGALRLAACLPAVTKADGLLMPGQLFEGNPATYDYRLGYMRAAAGLALLAIDGDGGCDVAPERLAAADMAISASVRRLLESGIGESGEGTGNGGYADLVEMLFPYLQAYRSVRGEDLAAGTGAESVGRMGAATRGACFQRGGDYPTAAWAPFVEPFTDAGLAGWLRSLTVASARDIADPWQGAVAALNLSRFSSPGSALCSVRAIEEDRAMGSYVLGDPNRDRFLYFRGGSGPDSAAALRGDLCLYACGREWMASHAVAPGDFSWPKAGIRNGIALVQEDKAGHKTALVPGMAGFIDRVRFDRTNALLDGSGSVCMQADSDVRLSGRRGRGGDVFRFEGGGGIGGSEWCAVGVDFSRASGAEVLVVLVEGVTLVGADADRYWEMDAGPVSESDVVRGPGTFLVSPPGTNVTLRGTFVRPAGVDVVYVPPNGVQGGRIRAFLNRKVTNKDLSLDHAIRTKAFGVDVEADLRTAEEAKGDEKMESLRRAQSAVLAEIIRKESYAAASADMRGTNSCVVVLTVQRGEPPRVEPAATSGGFLVKVGGQTVFYEDSALVFERRNR